MSALKTRQELLKMSKTELMRFMKKQKLYKSTLTKSALINKYLERAKSIKTAEKQSKKAVKNLSLTQRTEYLCSGYIRKNILNSSHEINLFSLIISYIGNIFITFDVYNNQFNKYIKQMKNGTIFNRKTITYALTSEEHHRMSNYINARRNGTRTKMGFSARQRGRILIGSSCGMRSGKNIWNIKMLCNVENGYGNDGFGVTSKLKTVKHGFMNNYSQETYNVAKKFKAKKSYKENKKEKHLVLFYVSQFKKNDILTLILDFDELELKLKCNESVTDTLTIENDCTYYPVIFSQCDNRKYQMLNY